MLSHVQLFTTPGTAAHQASLFFTVFQNLLKLIHWVSDATQTSHPVTPFSSCPQYFPASGSSPMSQLFKSGGSKYWSFSFSISPSNEYSRLISFRIDWFDLLAVQGTLKSLLQHHNSQFKSINSSALSLLYSPILTSVHDYWEKL